MDPLENPVPPKLAFHNLATLHICLSIHKISTGNSFDSPEPGIIDIKCNADEARRRSGYQSRSTFNISSSLISSPLLSFLNVEICSCSAGFQNRLYRARFDGQYRTSWTEFRKLPILQ